MLRPATLLPSVQDLLGKVLVQGGGAVLRVNSIRGLQWRLVYLAPRDI